ncbi:MAG TPA: YdbL family protein [Caulobacteraceae bacterium]|nr:YdbL family protein [Caulobacteraceae bacterium]
MIRRLLLVATLGAGLIAGGVSAQTSAEKGTVDAAKAQGVIGEQADGFLGLVAGSGPADVRAAMAAINAGRAGAYKDIAAKTGVSDVAAGEATARQLIERLPAGEYYRPLNGGWTRK